MLHATGCQVAPCWRGLSDCGAVRLLCAARTGWSRYSWGGAPDAALSPDTDAADDDVEGVVIHSDAEGRLAPASLCRGQGSFRLELARLGEPLPGQDKDKEGGGNEVAACGGRQREREERYAATV